MIPRAMRRGERQVSRDVPAGIHLGPNIVHYWRLPVCISNVQGVMMNQAIKALCLATLVGVAQLAVAEDAELCLDCHEPAEDWEGMSEQEILAHAKDAGIKRHADNLELSDENLKAIIAELLAE
jgi:hypothetical protein